MDWSCDDLGDAISLFKQKMILFFEDENIDSDEAKARKICRGIGDEGLRRLNVSGLTDEKKRKPDELWQFFENQLKVNINFRINRLHFMRYKQRPDESLDQFVIRARTLGLKCDFSDTELSERLLELIISSTPHEEFCRDLLSRPKGYSIAEILKEGRKYEALSAGNMKLKQMANGITEVHGIARATNQQCKRCGTRHKPRQCPAYKDECHTCGARGHWAKCCKTKNLVRKHDEPQRQHRKSTHNRGSRYRGRRYKSEKIDEINGDYEPDDEYQREFSEVIVSENCVHTPKQRHAREEAYTVLQVQPPNLPHDNYTLRVKIDTGAMGNTLPLRTFRQMYGKRVSTNELLTALGNVKLTAYNGQKIPCFGTIQIPCQHKNSVWDQATFYVVDVDGPAIVGLPTCERLHLVTINVDNVRDNTSDCGKPKVTPAQIHDIKDLVSLYPQQFDKIGNFKGTARLHLKDDAEAFIDAPRKCSVHIKDKLKQEIDNLVSQKVIRKVDEHTDWCSSLTFTTKKDGSIRICLDPKRLNDSLKRCPHKIPTVEELNPEFAHATVFSKLDAKAGYWAIHLDEDSQLLTTFRTPFGRYCWQRLPFGLSTSQDIFQARMDEIMEGLNGVVSIADDVCVHGRNAADMMPTLSNS